MSESFATPKDFVSKAADAGIKAISDYLRLEPGAEIDQLVILLRAKGLPDGEEDTVSAGHGIEDARELIALMGSHFIEAADQVGIKVQLVPLNKPIGGDM